MCVRRAIGGRTTKIAGFNGLFLGAREIPQDFVISIDVIVECSARVKCHLLILASRLRQNKQMLFLTLYLIKVTDGAVTYSLRTQGHAR